MIRFENVSVTYDGASEPTVRGVDLTIPEGELVLLAGPSGVGKSTLLGTVSGLVPHFTGGTLRGRVTVAGRDTRTHKPRELSDVVGTVGQDPLSHFVTDTVEEELAYGMESLGLAPEVMRRRVEETLDLLGLAALRDRPIATLSGGQQQRVAIGSVLTPHPRVLVLDEPTSALDPAAAEEVLAVLLRLVHDLGTTVLLAEHRLERVLQYADQVALLPSPGTPPLLGTPADMMSVSPVYPPVVALGRLAHWTPLPLTVRDARRRATDLRERLAVLTPTGGKPQAAPTTAGTWTTPTAPATGTGPTAPATGTGPASTASRATTAGPATATATASATAARPTNATDPATGEDPASTASPAIAADPMTADGPATVAAHPTGTTPVSADAPAIPADPATPPTPVSEHTRATGVPTTTADATNAPGPATGVGPASGGTPAAVTATAAVTAPAADPSSGGEAVEPTPSAIVSPSPAPATRPVAAPRWRLFGKLTGRGRDGSRAKTPGQPPAHAPTDPATPAPPAAEVHALSVRRGHVQALRRIGLTLVAGETVALMGRNGAGKSTLLSTLVGLVEPSAGTVEVGGVTPHRTSPRDLVRRVGLVPQEPRDLLYADTVAGECAAADRDAQAEPGTCRALVSGLLPGIADDVHPRDLSEGQRLTLALAVVLTARPPLLLLDEPTRGLDYAAKARLVAVLRELAAAGHAIVLATHDVELAAELAHRVVLLAEGEVIADGPTAEVVVSSPSFAPQVTKILAPQEWLTVAQVREALA
ncbi:ABC transporter ATP-binding protein [Streptomyces antibioticus]|uniref:ABC transporter ATP-binding protein n=1 Tax=Streptomyces antibioticus TaxID=1890 RepID=UPI0022595AAE|nr:ATP-binding cassette domain-containing protein [Streptomyces antibioticus]MCX4739478.1 ATP-binding cassette domain-containing protein [Streptomyces antibioticus]